VLGAGRAARLHATIALAQRGWSEPPRRAFVGTASAAVAWLLPRFAGLRHEELHGLVLNRRLEVVAVRRLSQGTTDQTLFDVRLILGEVLRAGGHGIVLAHNHPSGEVEPSDTDLLVTRRLVEGATLLGITVVDHLVVSGVEWVSLAERGHLPTVRALTPSPIA
jgi:DNA repair protein RadC